MSSPRCCSRRTLAARPRGAAAEPAKKPGVLRVDCGASEPYKDKLGNVWAADQELGDRQDLGRGRRHDLRPPRTWGSQAQRSPGSTKPSGYSMESYKVTVPNGKYTVRLHFAETFDGITGPEGRVFSVSVPGQGMLKDLDLYRALWGRSSPWSRSTRVWLSRTVSW